MGAGGGSVAAPLTLDAPNARAGAPGRAAISFADRAGRATSPGR